METKKKLVLGFCVLAAVTGSAPQVFGGDISPKEMLLYISDETGRLLAQGRLAGEKGRLKVETKELASRCNDAIGLVRSIRVNERRAYILSTLADCKEREINDEISCRQNDLTSAKNALEGARYFRRLRTAIVTWRKSKLEKAEQKKTLILKLRHMADGFTEAANQTRTGASEFNAARVARLTEFTTARINERETDLIADAESFRRGGLSVAELEMMEGRLAIDVVVLDAAELISRDEERVNDAAYDQLPEDYYEWFCLNVGGGRRLYNKLVAEYRPKKVDYACSADFNVQIERLKSAFSGSAHLEAQVRARLIDAREANFARP